MIWNSTIIYGSLITDCFTILYYNIAFIINRTFPVISLGIVANGKEMPKPMLCLKRGDRRLFRLLSKI